MPFWHKFETTGAFAAVPEVLLRRCKTREETSLPRTWGQLDQSHWADRVCITESLERQGMNVNCEETSVHSLPFAGSIIADYAHFFRESAIQPLGHKDLSVHT